MVFFPTYTKHENILLHEVSLKHSDHICGETSMVCIWVLTNINVAFFPPHWISIHLLTFSGFFFLRGPQMQKEKDKPKQTMASI